MSSLVAELARRLARDAEAVCRYYLSNGRRHGRYWRVGDVQNTPGRSLFVRLYGPDSGKGAAGKWTDAATGEHGDLLDLIAHNRGLDRFGDVLDEARAFLGVPRSARASERPYSPSLSPAGSPESARRLLAVSQPIPGTLAEKYLKARGITALPQTSGLRYHPRCYYRPDTDSPAEIWPALIAAVTDLEGRVTGAHRTWLDPSGTGKAPLDTPRRAMGYLLGHGVRFGVTDGVMAAGEGIETMLSLRMALPSMPMIAALSAGHLAVMLFPPGLRRLYIARDGDAAGNGAAEKLTGRARAAGIDAITLSPVLSDFNDDLRCRGIDELCVALRSQLVPQDVPRFMRLPAIGSQ